jgi:hypothetical protein
LPPPNIALKIPIIISTIPSNNFKIPSRINITIVYLRDVIKIAKQKEPYK